MNGIRQKAICTTWPSLYQSDSIADSLAGLGVAKLHSHCLAALHKKFH